MAAETLPQTDYVYDYREANWMNSTMELYDYEDAHGPVTVVSTVLYSIIFLLGIPGNAVVIWCGGLKMKKTVSSVWFVNLAVVNFLCCLTLPFMITYTALQFYWPFGHFFCKLIPSVTFINMFVSVFTLTTISIDRCLLVVKPAWYLNKRTVCMASVFCLIIWILATIMSLPGFILLGSTPNSEHVGCHHVGEPAYIRTFYIVSSITWATVGILIPFLVILTCCIIISLNVKGCDIVKFNRNFKVILSAIMAYFISWLPCHIIEILLALSDLDNLPEEIFNFFYPFVLILSFSNSCVNPILYVCLGQNFKGTLRWSMRHVLENAFGEKSMMSTSHSWQRLSIERDVASSSSVNASG
ncbi:C3a anaphylatoxin chemotactic receptor-like [Latimeria chalumnae]|uniref:C3a anaphylatoxin chemotactic receptor n=1 Tax=Latimeria chalumnae TaxID=7897 RepID=M3XHV7_LATCH|nr:PREDICTED: C3a anaphylatoxin chemotactic receptor-like [Latimeria chalumnae]|eukprot:XP_006004722.1 PREDICTED: C3a anaphylatoxin chemotactic receptor-like [Latimeria chalumnae]